MTAPVLGAGFRPFFLAAALWAAIALALSICALTGHLDLPSRFDPLAWHIHEMLFGFVMAGVGGFLLTAIPNWTGRAPVSGAPLGVLVAAWALGRAVCLVSAWLPAWIAPTADLLFPVALELVAARELLAANNRRNYPLLLPVTVLGAANLLMHLEALDVAVPSGLGWRLGIATVLILISVIGGRIIPAFTRNWLTARGATALPPPVGTIDRAALGTLHASLLLWAALPAVAWVGVALLLGAATNLWRLLRWRGAATMVEPLLSVLHFGYLWLVAGVALLGLSMLCPASPQAAALHALTAGAFGTMLLAVMTRATLGHTGRRLHADGATLAIYALVGIAAILRILAAWSSHVSYDLLIAAAVCWIAAFGLFVARYGPMLVTTSLAGRAE